MMSFMLDLFIWRENISLEGCKFQGIFLQLMRICYYWRGLKCHPSKLMTYVEGERKSPPKNLGVRGQELAIGDVNEFGVCQMAMEQDGVGWGFRFPLLLHVGNEGDIYDDFFSTLSLPHPTSCVGRIRCGLIKSKRKFV